MRDLVSNIGVVEAIAPAVLTADASSTAIDLTNFDSAAVIVTTGAIVGSGLFNLVVADSDDGVNFGAAVATVTGLAANSAYKLGYPGSKRFIKVTADYQSGTSLALSAAVVKGNPHLRPV